jgi:hypothetical protein
MMTYYFSTISLLREAVADITPLIEKGKKLWLNQWVDQRLSKEEQEKIADAEEPVCGTVACAAGWLAQFKKWQQRGLKLYVAPYDALSPENAGKIIVLGRPNQDKVPSSGDGYDALADIFHINFNDITDIFGTTGLSDYDSLIFQYNSNARYDHFELWKARIQVFADQYVTLKFGRRYYTGIENSIVGWSENRDDAQLINKDEANHVRMSICAVLSSGVMIIDKDEMKLEAC